jgi:VWFA-related protein
MKKKALFVVFCLIIIQSPLFALGGASIRIDYIDIENFLNKNQIRFYVDLLDGNNNPIMKVPTNAFSLFIKDKEDPVKGEFDVRIFNDLKDESVAVLIFLAAHREYAIPVSTRGGGQIQVIEKVKEGVINFIKNLSPNDKIAVYTYNESTRDMLHTFTNVNDSAWEDVEKLAISKDSSETAKDKEAVSPQFYKLTKEIIEQVIGAEKNLPRRKILLLVSDGLDRFKGDSKRLTKSIDAIIEASYESRTKIYSIGYTPSDLKNLKLLQTISEKTGGVYRKTESVEDLPSIIENVSQEIKRQYVLTFSSDDLEGGKPTLFRIQAAVGGQKIEHQYDEEIKLPKKPIPWLKIVFTVVGILLGIVVLILLIKFIIYVIRERQRRAEEKPEEEEYTGPSLGKLTAKSGPVAGKIFHIAEHYVTVGKLSGNHIVVQDTSISKKHASIKVDDTGKYEIEDLGSVNGIFVNGRKTMKAFLKDGDTIKLGNTELTFTIK